MNNSLNILTDKEQQARLARVTEAMAQCGDPDAILVSDFANIYYLTGRVFDGYVYISRSMPPVYFVRRPLHLEGDGVVYIHKPEQIPLTLEANLPAKLGLELAQTSYLQIERLKVVFPDSEIIDASIIMRQARAVKTSGEIALITRSGEKQDYVYSRIPGLYKPGMTDIELQIEIERLARRQGCLGQFRISGTSMELFMGNVLAGDNADNPTPYDFAMGGGGLDPSLPVGADGSEIRQGCSVMVDVNGNFTGYMTDMTRTYAPAPLNELANKAHQCSIDICHRLAAMALPGTKASDLYDEAVTMATQAGLENYFMGHNQKAKFIGHGVGIEINELPVIAPKSRDLIQEGNVIALEPKFVIPHVGAVGIENTYVATSEGLQPLTHSPEEITLL